MNAALSPSLPLDVVPAGLGPDDLLRMYRGMVTIRAYDERAMNLQRSGRISFCVISTGEEATQIGTAAALTATDWIFPSYRQHGVAMWRGASLEAMAHQLFGTALDNIKGRQMPCHYSFMDLRFISVSSVIGTQMIQAVGAAMAQQIQQTQDIAITYFGDGATSANDFHSAMNLAGVKKAPVLFVCINNQYAISTPLSKQTACTNIATKAVAYGMPGVTVDGTDVLAIYKATLAAADRARRGEGPTLLELLTYRHAPHSSSDDPSRYRELSEGEPWLAKDPIIRLGDQLVEWQVATVEDLERIKAECVEAVLAATKVAESAPLPDAATLFDDVYAELPASLQAQKTELLAALSASGHTSVGHAEGEFPL
jgi:pyruvate dehydrogenase E1 component alpha subunit